MHISDMPTMLIPSIPQSKNCYRLPQDTQYTLPIPGKWQAMINSGDMNVIPPSGTRIVRTYFLSTVRCNPQLQYDLAVMKFKAEYGIIPDTVYLNGSRTLYMTTSDRIQSDDSLPPSLVRCVLVVE